MTKRSGRPFKHNLEGRTFGRLKVIGLAPFVHGRKTKWQCVCECGNKPLINCASLLAGTQSCGCFFLETMRKARKHGAAILSSGNGLTAEYKAWARAKRRCYSPSCDKFARYGGRGIVMDDRWRNDFNAFLADMGPCPSGYELDRIDNDGPYAPGNCRWATRREQMNHTSATRYIEHAGKRMSVANWSRETGIAYSCLIGRLNSGWKVEHALSR